MHITLISIFPEIFQSFLTTSLIAKAQEKKILTFSCLNPRDFTDDKHHIVDDQVYGGSQGMLMKAEPLIRSIQKAVADAQSRGVTHPQIIFPTPSSTLWTQRLATTLSSQSELILVSGRYEGIDQRVYDWCHAQYPGQVHQISLGQFITLGGETPSMVMVESIVRLIPGVIKEESSHLDESYALDPDADQDMSTLEYPQYTRPEVVRGMAVPEVLLSGHHAAIDMRKQNNIQKI